MARTVKMKAPPNTNEANVGADQFRVGEDGTVEVGEDAVSALQTAGFEVESDPVEMPAGRARMKAPAGATACSARGETCEVDAQGFVEVPIEAVLDLMSHGFEPVAS